jgi:hypothetical protein
MNTAELKQSKRLEISSTVLLALATLAVTWCTYQSALWNSAQTFRLAEFNLHSRLAQQYAGIANMRKELDAAVAIDFLNAVIEKRQQRVSYYLTRTRPDFRSILQKWIDMDPINNQDAPAHPLAMQEYEALMHALMVSSDSAAGKAQITWQQARKANSISDRYVLTTVVFSLVMFLGAVSTKLSHIQTSRLTMIIAGSIYFLTLLVLFLMPVRWND